jgi:hypothetical protein
MNATLWLHHSSDFPSIYDEKLYLTGGIMESDGKRMTGFATFGNIPPRCIEAHWLKTNRRQQRCPEP